MTTTITTPAQADTRRTIRLQRTDVLRSINHEILIVLDPAGSGWQGGQTLRRVGHREATSEPLYFADEAALDAHIAALLGQGYHRTALAERPKEEGGGLEERLEPRVQAVLDWIYAAASGSISDFLKGKVEALAPATIAEARAVVAQISDLFQQQLLGPSKARRQQIADLVNRYYALIPTRLPKRVRPDALIDDFTSNFDVHNDRLDQLAGALATITAPHTGKQTALGCTFIPVDQGTPEWAEVSRFMARRSEMAPAMRWSQAFRVIHPILEARYAASTRGKSDIRLLSHGTRAGNWQSIMALGLKLPAAMVNGWSLGAGIYFADEPAKSMNYVGAQVEGKSALLICEVALGTPHRVGSYSGRELPAGCDSIFSGAVEGRYLYNEYVIFDEAQQAPRYLVVVE